MLNDSAELAKRKMVNFDLDTNELKKIFPDYTVAYYKLKASFIRRGFEHRQGSGYMSINALSNVKMRLIIRDITKENSWLKTSIKKIDVADLPELHDFRDVVLRTKTTQNSHTTKEARRDDDEIERD